MVFYGFLPKSSHDCKKSVYNTFHILCIILFPTCAFRSSAQTHGSLLDDVCSGLGDGWIGKLGFSFNQGMGLREVYKRKSLGGGAIGIGGGNEGGKKEIKPKVPNGVFQKIHMPGVPSWCSGFFFFSSSFFSYGFS